MGIPSNVKVVTRSMVVGVARRMGWQPWGQFRRYGPFMLQCFRRGMKYCWISDDTVECAGDVVALEFVEASPQEVVEWLR